MCLVKAISISAFRNLEQQVVFLHPESNIVLGDNGSGKTSFLESLFFVCNAKSFRTNTPNEAIQNSERVALLEARFKSKLNQENNTSVEDTTSVSLKLEKPNKKMLQIEAKPVSNSSTLALLFPCYYFSPVSLNLLEGDPSLRRNLIDWLMFHVEQPIYNQYIAQYRKLLKSRNKLLKIKSAYDGNQDRFWLSELVTVANNLEDLRRNHLNNLNKVFDDLKFEFLAFSKNVHLEYYKGWKSNDLLGELSESLERDLILGSTSLGTHKSDLKVRNQKRQIKSSLSRGQIKLLTLTLVVAVLKYVSEVRQQKVLFLIDDLFAELDPNSFKIAIKLINLLNTQCIITCNNADLAGQTDSLFNSLSMFHVEQGKINEVQ
ncbi:MAG: DNA replication and repair protein RecF [Alteromonadaceae bacterium]|nr:DNA replication and repair protein RecF [Alteromonadaceae bacterium]